TYDGSGSIYAFRGNSTTDFWKYAISTNTWSVMTVAPGAVYQGGSSTYGSGSIYAFRGGDTTTFWKYNINNLAGAGLSNKRYVRYKAYLTGVSAWSVMTVAPGAVSYGGSSTYGSGSIYAFQGGNTTTFWKYAISTNTWSVMTVAPGTVYTGSSLTYDGSGSIYAFRGNSTTDFWKYAISTNTCEGDGISTAFWKYTISTNTWSTMAVAPATVYISSSLVYDGSGNIYANRSSNSVLFWKYTISTNTWSTMASVPTGGMNYGSLAYDGSGSIYAFQGGVTTTFWKYAISTNTWSVMTVAPGTVYYGSSLAYDGSGSIYAFRGNTTTAFWKYNINTRSAPSFTDATISYTQYPSSGELISSRYDASDAANLIAKISWNETATSTTNKVRLQIRSSPDGSTWSEWCGYADTGSTCAGTNYFDFDKNNVTLGTDNPLRNNNNDRYLQYKVRLESDSAGTAVADNVVITYVVNAAPQFDASYGTNGILISSQIATSTDNNWGKMEIWHRVEDTDTLTGATPNKLATTFDYRLNSSAGWTAIPLANLNPSSTSTRIAANSYNTTSTIWDAPSQISGNYSTTTQIRVTANDSEAANNIASSTSAAFTLDTKVPTAGGLTFDSSAGATTGNILGYTFADDSNIQYRISNNADFSADNNSRNDWQTLNASSTGASSTTWITPAASGATEKVYYQARDAYGNTMASGTVTAPGIGTQNLAGINLKDVSNTNTGQWQEFISWSPYTSETDATFASYKLYRSTDGANYSLLTTITASSTNYYTDTSVSSSTDYYYKIKVTDTDGDVSEFSASADDVVDGQGGTDIVAPIISNASSTEVQSTWAKITWTTDEYSDSKVLYGTATGNYTASSSVDTLLASSTPHAVYLTGLTPGATYYFMVRSKDIVNNSADSSEYSFTTIPGVTISDVACIDQTGTSLSVIWNTNQATVSSAVEYSANASLASYSSASVSAVSSVSNNYYQQKAPITGLSQGLPYYFRVKSTNSGGNVSIDNNSGNFYICRTTRDTKPPVISGVATPVLTDSSAVVIWTTDEPASSKVEYGTTASSTAGSYATSTIQDSTLTTSHVVTLTGLIKETKYYYRVRSNDLNTGNSDAVSNENEFTTAAERQTIIVYVGAAVVSNAATAGDMTGPVISDIKVESVGSFDAVISFSTNEDATAFIDYGETNGYGTTVGSSQFSTSHRFKLTGLKMGTQYHFKAKAIDKANNFSDAGDETFTTKYFTEALQDLITLERASQFQEAIEKSIESILPSLLPPFIEKPRVTDITENSAILRWKTNIKSYSVALYAGDKDFNASAVNPYTGEVSDTETKTVDHEIALTGLSPSTQYHFMVKSFILPQVMGRSEDMTFITKSSPIKPRIADIDNDAITIAWITDSLASSIVEYKNLQTNEINRKTNEFLTKDHNVKIENLTPDTSYEIQAMGYGEKGNLIEAGEAITARTSRDVTPPTLSNLRIDSAMVSGRTDRVQTIVSWKTDEPANSFVEYEEGSGKGDGTLANKSGDSDVFVQDHNVIITKLKPGLLYRIKVISVDDANNKTVSPIRTIITPRQTESIVDVIVKNFEDTFQFLQKIR
ncbi:MAG: Fibronectin type III domain protein, partial [Candidatus Wolfebacteria bacterium GW2011_GWB1_41_12]